MWEPGSGQGQEVTQLMDGTISRNRKCGWQECVLEHICLTMHPPKKRGSGWKLRVDQRIWESRFCLEIAVSLEVVWFCWAVIHSAPNELSTVCQAFTPVLDIQGDKRLLVLLPQPREPVCS